MMLNQSELEYAIKRIHSAEGVVDAHERMILENYRKMVIGEQKDILTHLIERAQLYNNSVVAGGYAAFFAAWAFFRSELTNPLYDLTMLLMLVSVFVFVIWNIYTNIITGRMLYRKSETISRNLHDPVYLFQALEELNQLTINRTLRSQKYWLLSLWMTVLPAAVSAILFLTLISLSLWSRMAY